MEKRVQEQDPVWSNRQRIQQHRLWLFLDLKRCQRRLNHDERIHALLSQETVSVERRFVRRRVEDLDEIGPSQVVHELRKEVQILRQHQRARIAHFVGSKLGTQIHQYLVAPPNGVRGVVSQHLVQCFTSNQHSGSLLVEKINQILPRLQTWLVTGGHVQSTRAVRVLVAGDKLYDPERLANLNDRLEIHAVRGMHRDSAEFPRVRSAHANLLVRHKRRLVLERGHVTDDTTELEVICGFDLERGVEAELKGACRGAVEKSLQGLFENGCREPIALDRRASRSVHETLHFGKADLVVGADKYVDCVTCFGRNGCELFGPPVNSIRRAPDLANVDESRLVATFKAAPVARWFLWYFSTGNESGVRDSIKVVS
ncbi:hypothetical protein OGATHE_000676 [Ogataea polymorpha]|uniref:Uncharacterized protein n=1 Tax=Ogataea polymorpha TaxID=460523 RepID=A0A9P8TH01_9ASCO|nr:hypothetical protein OGATHE_000676 [Ogataea polymorpha]